MKTPNRSRRKNGNARSLFGVLMATIITVTVIAGCGKKYGGGTGAETGESAVVSGDALTDTAGLEHHAVPVDDSNPDTAGLEHHAVPVDDSNPDTARLAFVPGSQFNPNINYGSFTDPRDGKSYRTVVIGTQTWMAENLNFATSDSSWCHENSPDSCAEYGRLYNWNAAMKACPAGWRLPTNEDWDELMEATGGNKEFGGMYLQSAAGWNTGCGHISGIDDFGFSAMPGGYLWGGGFDYVGDRGWWWSATEHGATDAWYRMMGNYIDSDVHAAWDKKTSGFSLRCVRDN